jgi:hypothetical protein
LDSLFPGEEQGRRSVFRLRPCRRAFLRGRRVVARRLRTDGRPRCFPVGRTDSTAGCGEQRPRGRVANAQRSKGSCRRCADVSNRTCWRDHVQRLRYSAQLTGKGVPWQIKTTSPALHQRSVLLAPIENWKIVRARRAKIVSGLLMQTARVSDRRPRPSLRARAVDWTIRPDMRAQRGRHVRSYLLAGCVLHFLVGKTALHWLSWAIRSATEHDAPRPDSLRGRWEPRQNRKRPLNRRAFPIPTSIT